MRISPRAYVWLVPAFSLSFLGGCPGTLADKEAYEAALDGGRKVDGGALPCDDVVARIFAPKCGGGGCHGANAPQQDLDLVSPGVAARVVDVAGKGCSALLADPANPTASLIYQKLSPNPPCGSPMPLARPPLSDAETACVLAWIAAQ